MVEIRQVVQVSILGAARAYTYEYFFDLAKGEQSLGMGDKVELPPNQVQEDGSSGTVVDLGSNYEGPMRRIVRVIKRAHDPRDDSDSLWEGFGEGDYA